MRKASFIFLLAVALFFSGPQPSYSMQSGYAEGEVLVLMKGSAVTRFSAYGEDAGEVIRRRARALPGNPQDVEAEAFVRLSKSSGRSFAMLRSKGEKTDEMIARLKNDPDVLGVARNYNRYALDTPPNDPLYTSQKQAFIDIGAPELWDEGTGSADIVVATIDTGLIYDHPDLKDNVYTFDPSFWEGGDFVGVHGIWFSRSYVDDNGNLVSGIVIGINGAPTNNNWQSGPAHIGDANGHGTHVAGIIGAVGNNNLGVAGVNWKVKILPVNVFSYSGLSQGFSYASDADILNALEFLLEVKEEGINLRAVNMSIGGWSRVVDQNTDPLGQALKKLSDADVLISIAAGNEYQNIDNPTGSYAGQLPYPAAYKFENTITVGGLALSGGTFKQKANYSNYSSTGTYVDLFAPGDKILSTVRSQYLVTSDTRYEFFHSSGYMQVSGTSMAAPMVTGAAALLMSLYPEKSATEIKSMLLAGANPAIAKTNLSKYGALNLPGAYNFDTLAASSDTSVVYEVQGSALQDSAAQFALLTDAAEIPNASLRSAAEAADGGLTLKSAAVTNIIDSLRGADELRYTPSVLPMFKLTGTQAGKVYAVEFEVQGNRLGSARADLRVAKATGANAGRLFTWAGSPSAYADGTYTLLDANGNTVTGALSATADYRLLLFLADDGQYDLNKNAGTIVDPTILYTILEYKQSAGNPANPDNPSNPGSDGGGGGGGCSAASGLWALLLLVPLLLFLEKRKAE